MITPGYVMVFQVGVLLSKCLSQVLGEEPLLANGVEVFLRVWGGSCGLVADRLGCAKLACKGSGHLPSRACSSSQGAEHDAGMREDKIMN